MTSRTAPDVAEVYELYEDEKWTTKEIANHFDVSTNEITAIRRSDEYQEFERLSEDFLPSLAGQTGKFLDKRKKETCKDDDGQHPFAPLITNRDRRVEDKERLIKYVLNSPHATPLTGIVSDVFDLDNPTGSDRDYQFARRFYTDHPDYFDVSERNGMTAVTYHPEFVDLISQGIIQDSSIRSDREFCKTLLDSTVSLSPDVRETLADSVQSYVQRIENYHVFLEPRDGFRGQLNDSLIRIPYKTRFNDVGRIKKQWAKLQQGLEFAGRAYCTPHDGDGYERETSDRCWLDDKQRGAVFATLTTDPKRHSSLLDANDNMSDSVNKLMGWLSDKPKTLQDGRERWSGRLPYIKVLEFTGSSNSEYHGLPHVHVIFFDVPVNEDGVPYLVDKNALSEYWSENCGQGEIVDLQPLVYRENLPDSYSMDSGFVAYDEDYAGKQHEGVASNQTVGQYLGKYLSVIYGGMLDLLEDTPELEDLDLDDKYADKAEAWKVGAYWATGKRIMSMSRGLEDEVLRDDGLDYSLPSHQFLGAYHENDVPTRLWRDSTPMDSFAEVYYSTRPEISRSEGDRPPPEEA